ncbi:AEC family transporter [Maribrevibacterium harenarium]|uniref:AEC family transporter n=1 Tax=Maribrevibacterium harenarium TaxID=2589817 RepID=A0A501WMF6_9GAMM|nr:AEC family transporter [Maribrevibacterium harenarium]TPE46916.1 AEC family transporter [Maribrevibacterium harenarium]
MEAVLNITAPIFLLILFGFVAVRYGVLPKESLPGLSRFVLYLALPALVFTKVATMDIRAIVDFPFMASYAVGGLSAFFGTLLLARWLFADNALNGGVKAIGATMPNSAFIGFPVLMQFFGHAPTQAFAMAVMVENILFMPIALAFIEAMYGKQQPREKSMVLVISKRVLTNPIIIAVCSGAAVSLLGIPLPEFLQKGLDMLAMGSAPAALVVIGGSLVGVTIRGSLAPISLVVVMKLLFFPSVVAAVTLLFPQMPQELRYSVILFAAMPMFSVYPIIGGEYGDRSFCASTLLITTVASFFTLSALLRFLI